MFARPHPLCLPRASPNTCLLLRDYLVLPRKQQSLKPVLPVCAQGATPAFIGVQKNPGSWQGELFSMLCAFWSFAAPTKPHDEPMATWAALQLAGSCPRGAPRGPCPDAQPGPGRRRGRAPESPPRGRAPESRPRGRAPGSRPPEPPAHQRPAAAAPPAARAPPAAPARSAAQRRAQHRPRW